MRHLASPRFWGLYNALPADIRALADKNFALLKSDPHYPSLHFKRSLCANLRSIVLRLTVGFPREQSARLGTG
ncbi:MAG: hypothetical protein ACRD19_10260 [Terriglobia bacterium]